MIKVLKASEVQDLEQHYLEDHPDVSLDDLMQEAGTKAAQKIIALYDPQSTLIIAGPGNNGGDGHVVANYLKGQSWDVTVISPADYATIQWDKYGLIIDAIFGIGLSKKIEGAYRDVIDAMNASIAPCVSIDVPSGISSDSGQIMGVAVQAEHTLTFAFKKVGLMLLPGKSYAGKVHLLPMSYDAACEFYQMQELTSDLFVPYYQAPDLDTNKYKKGHLCIITENDYPGAIILATMAARKTGIGYVTILAPEARPYDYVQAIPGVVVKSYASHQDIFDFIATHHVSEILIGSGVKPSLQIRCLVQDLCTLKMPLVLDAGAITAFEGAFDVFESCLHEKVLLLPHEGELRKLLKGQLDFESKYDILQHPALFRKGHWFIKGNDGLIFSDSDIYCLGEGSAKLAVAGSGDVLAGVAAGLLSYFSSPLHVLQCAVWVHHEAGECKQFALVAEELPALIDHILYVLFSQEELPKK